jgi:energy-coupling factor transporter ATP-binding protein EcfA2
MPFGQVIIGPPGSGKSTFCLASAAFMRASGRTVCTVNLDPANDDLPYECDIDIADLVSLDAVQQETGLGPNGGLAYCMDYLEKNFDWLQVRSVRAFAASSLQPRAATAQCVGTPALCAAWPRSTGGPCVGNSPRLQIAARSPNVCIVTSADAACAGAPRAAAAGRRLLRL